MDASVFTAVGAIAGAVSAVAGLVKVVVVESPLFENSFRNVFDLHRYTDPDSAEQRSCYNIKDVVLFGQGQPA